MVEGDALVEGLEKITYEVKFEPLPRGGSISKVSSNYYTKDDFKLKEEDIKAGKERVACTRSWKTISSRTLMLMLDLKLVCRICSR